MKSSLLNLRKSETRASISQGRRTSSVRLAGRLLVALVLPCLSAAGAAAPPSAANEQVRKLTGVLQSQATQKEKADACRELARVADRDAIAVLASLLPEESLSHMARYALETIPDPEVDKAFRAAIQKLQGRPLVGVIGSTGVRRDAKAVKLLVRRLTDSDPDVAQAAARSLGKIGNPAAAKALQRALRSVSAANQLAFCEGLLRCAESLAANGRRKSAIAMYDSLRKLELPHQARTAALRGAVLTRQKDGLPLLLEAIRNGDFAVFAAAARISMEVPGEQTTRALAGELPHLSTDKQIVLSQTLARRSDPAALPALLAAAKGGEKPVRLAAVRAVSEFGNPTAIPVLTGLMAGDDRELAQAAQEALAGLPGAEADAAVLALLRSAEEDRRNTGMDLVVRRRMTQAIPELYSAAAGPDPKTRVTAVRRLADLAGPQEIPGLLDLLAKAKTPEDLEAAEQALSSVSLQVPNREGCAESLAAKLTVAQPAQKCALVRVLGALGGANALKAVRAAVSDSAAEVRAAAIRALGSWNNADAAPDLLQLARTAADPTEKALSLRSYLGLASQSEVPAEARLAMCREAASLVQSEEEKKLLLAGLGHIHSPESLALIQPYLDEAPVKGEAATALLSVAGKILEGADAAKNAAGLIEPLQKVAQANANSDLAKRAQTLVEKAQAKAK